MHVFVCMYKCMDMPMHVCVFVSLCVCVYVLVYARGCFYAFLCARTHVIFIGSVPLRASSVIVVLYCWHHYVINT